ncbi:MAG TPA: TetR/AcrR family transcriptional regulator [Burkholderiaceae bacterium]
MKNPEISLEAGDRKASILAAALVIFTEKGVEAATVDDIRKKSGASVGSIYHHFGAKDGIAAALFAHTLEDYWGRLMVAVESAADARAAIHALVDTHINWIVAKPDAARFLFSRRQAVGAAHEQAVRQHTAEHFKRLLAVFKPWFKQGILRQMPYELYVAILLGPAQELSRHWLGGRIALDPRDAIEDLSAAAWRGLAAEDCK